MKNLLLNNYTLISDGANTKYNPDIANEGVNIVVPYLQTQAENLLTDKSIKLNLQTSVSEKRNLTILNNNMKKSKQTVETCEYTQQRHDYIKSRLDNINAGIKDLESQMTNYDSSIAEYQRVKEMGANSSSVIISVLAPSLSNDESKKLGTNVLESLSENKNLELLILGNSDNVITGIVKTLQPHLIISMITQKVQQILVVGVKTLTLL